MTVTAPSAPAAARQVLPAEERHAAELAFLAAHDTGPRPPGWALTPRAVVTFVCGTDGTELALPKRRAGLPAKLAIAPKFVGERALVERCVVTLAGERGLLLTGEPGTAKSMLSELLAAAVSGTSALTRAPRARPRTPSATAGTTRSCSRRAPRRTHWSTPRSSPPCAPGAWSAWRRSPAASPRSRTRWCRSCRTVGSASPN